MNSLNIGCAGWSYNDWKGVFYPKSLAAGNYLSFYAKYFNCVEINTSFYHIPSHSTVSRWYEQTPPNFRFLVKIYRGLSHEFDYQKIDREISTFFYSFQPLNEKIGCYLLQFPPNYKKNEEKIKKIRYLMENFPKVEVAVEFRDNSWRDPEIFQIFHEHENWLLASSFRGDQPLEFPPNQSKYYLRIIGDRMLTKFNRIQRDYPDIFENITFNIEKWIDLPSITDIFVIFNNHFRGFSPADVNELKKRLNLPKKSFNPQRNLTDFFS